jgi:hypothetical protein
VRTAEAVIEKHEQILDGLERGSITGKVAEQMNQTIKGIMAVPRLELQHRTMLLKYGRKVPVPRSTILRDLLGVPEKPSPTDGEHVRGLLPEK